MNSLLFSVQFFCGKTFKNLTLMFYEVVYSSLLCTMILTSKSAFPSFTSSYYHKTPVEGNTIIPNLQLEKSRPLDVDLIAGGHQVLNFSPADSFYADLLYQLIWAYVWGALLKGRI
jgi:hypothetical protein